jgi:hypothetical protein
MLSPPVARLQILMLSIILLASTPVQSFSSEILYKATFNHPNLNYNVFMSADSAVFVLPNIHKSLVNAAVICNSGYIKLEKNAFPHPSISDHISLASELIQEYCPNSISNHQEFSDLIKSATQSSSDILSDVATQISFTYPFLDSFFNELNQAEQSTFLSPTKLECQTTAIPVPTTNAKFSYTYQFELEQTETTAIVKNFVRKEIAAFTPSEVIQHIEQTFDVSIDINHVDYLVNRLPLSTTISANLNDMCQHLINQAINFPGFQAALGTKPDINRIFLAEVALLMLDISI